MSDRDPEPITIETTDGSMPAHLWRPSAPTGPGLVLLHEIFGVGDYMQRRAADLAALGYVVCAPELFWRLGPEAMETVRHDVLEDALEVAGRADPDLCVADAAAAATYLAERPEVRGGVGLIGFCLGGGVAFATAAATSPDVLVSYYGSALPQLLDLAGQVRAPSLHHFGLADAYLPPEMVDKITDAVTTSPAVSVRTYPGAGHAFDNPLPQFHHAEASRIAWAATSRFLAKHLPAG
ncbi:MAG: dienelactone hydrolase family protein [Actinomycetes bacterium]